MSKYNDHPGDKKKKKEVKYHRFTKEQAEGKQKEKLHKEIKSDIDKFLQDGGEILELPIIRKDVR